MYMNQREYEQLTDILKDSAWNVRSRLMSFMADAVVSETPKGQRSTNQNNALHLYFKQVADALNDAGLDIRAVLKDTVDIPWSADTVKEHLWRPVQKLAVQKESTRDLTKPEVTYVWEIFNRAIAKHGVHVPFPTDDFSVRFQAMENVKSEDYPEYVKPTI